MKFLKKKNNKGFSLVELIVVILIMAIIAVALAPQVMKWVGEASDSTQENNAATIKSAVQICVTEFLAENGDLSSGATYTVASTGVTGATTNDAGVAELTTLIQAALSDVADLNETYTVTIAANGATVTVSY